MSGLARFLFGHEIFDEIVTAEFGSSILVLDENFIESKELISALIRKTDWASPVNSIEVTSGKASLGSGALTVGLPGEDLAYTSATLNEFRRSHRRWVIVHNYLPEFLVRYKSEDLLRLIESWRGTISENETVEFFLMPKGTFPETERVLKSVVDGVISISRRPEARFPTFSVVRSSPPEFAGKDFEYLIEGGRLLIKWGKDFVDRLPVSNEDRIRDRMKYLEDNSRFLKIVKGPNAETLDMPLEEKMIISQVIDKDVEQVLTVFCDRRHGILERLVRWSLARYIVFVNSDKTWSKPVKKSPSLRTRLALRLPTRLASWLITKAALSNKMMPIDAFWMKSKVDMAFYSSLFPKGLPTLSLELENIHEFIQDVATRLLTYEVIKKLGEDPRDSINIRYLPKIVGMMLKMGYSTDTKIEEAGEGAIRVKIKSCPVCEGVRTDKSYCSALAGAIKGNAAMCFKRKATCEETSCKAIGDEECVFYLELSSSEASEKPKNRLRAASRPEEVAS